MAEGTTTFLGAHWKGKIGHHCSLVVLTLSPIWISDRESPSPITSSGYSRIRVLSGSHDASEAFNAAISASRGQWVLSMQLLWILRSRGIKVPEKGMV